MPRKVNLVKQTEKQKEKRKRKSKKEGNGDQGELGVVIYSVVACLFLFHTTGAGS